MFVYRDAECIGQRDRGLHCDGRSSSTNRPHNATTTSRDQVQEEKEDSQDERYFHTIIMHKTHITRCLFIGMQSVSDKETVMEEVQAPDPVLSEGATTPKNTEGTCLHKGYKDMVSVPEQEQVQVATPNPTPEPVPPKSKKKGKSPNTDQDSSNLVILSQTYIPFNYKR